ncbi:SusC/RagA family TonB-linked outer membrane protein [Flavitalea sp. BT771]|uniref:SusC/RagA family TonB-linked outer membrane protein n=1 Tax=Flavitalea sp. BT771 TaxID=3063329 RepID=UPI0026E3589A|nr:SusC/RagA family TonB-linked outer membrane protein [Flavitalea sp. BT771]MDO6431678.1 SusC/RagA family TonB-linked outer membrane protein [Flavitalea sp. BT771]MDV6220586.1 SusC/RagA family TonB-linked outer membrane protein [Flavitalea sp. BT771]
MQKNCYWLFITLLFTILLNVRAAGQSQNITLSGKDLTLKQVFTAIEKRTGYVLLSKKNIFDQAKRVSFSVSDMSLRDFLNLVLKDQPFEYVIQGKTILVSQKEQSGASPTPAESGASPVKIRVVDAEGGPLVGASVAIDVRKTGFTDGEGIFTGNADAGDAVTVSYVGYETKIIILTALQMRNVIVTVSLKQATDNLRDVNVVVNTGYQSLPKERATGSFGVVTSKQLAQVPVVSVLERLQGMVPGVDISTKTTAGQSRNGTVTIRGFSTIKSSYTVVSTDPLLVIDGFPSQMSISDGALDYLNPDDIEQITFLKDAAAASIWGIQAANGVIVVTTRKGVRNGKPTLSFTTTLGTSSRPGAKYGTLMNIKDYIAMEKELIDKGRLYDPTLTTSGFYPPNNSQAQAIYWSYKRGEISQGEMDQKLNALAAVDNGDEIAKYMLQSPSTQQYNLSISGGGPNSSYFVSGYLYQDKRIYRSNTNKGYSLHAGGTSSFLDGLITASYDLTFANTRDKVNMAAVNAMSVGDRGMRPYDRLVDDSGHAVYYDVLLVPSIARNFESKGYLPFRYSPIDELNYSNTIQNNNNFNFDGSITGKITPWLNAVVAGNISRTFMDEETYWEPDSYDARLLVNTATSINGTGARIYGIPPGGKDKLVNSLGRSYGVRGLLNINKNWENKHQLSMVIGSEIRENYTKSSGETRYGSDKTINAFVPVNPYVYYTDIYGITQTIGATSSAVVEKTIRSMSYYGNGAYTFNNKYTVSGSTRFDDQNLLGVERRKRAIPLWSSGVKWNLGREDFMKHIGWLDRLALRFTYGFSGNAPQGYAPVTVVSLYRDYYTGLRVGNISTPAIDNLAWEKTRMVNYGIDFSLFKNRFSGSLEYYRKYTTDIIWQLPINGTYGFTSLAFNTANLHGSGIDIGLNVISLETKDWKLTHYLNISYNTNIIRDLRFKKPTTSFGAEYLYDGYPTDYLFSYKWAGLDSTGQSLIADPKIKGKTYTVMDYPFTDIRVYSGRTTSPWFGSFGNSLIYKGLELNVQFLYAFGGIFRKPSINDVGFSNNNYVGRSGDLEQRWKKPGDEAFTNVPGLEFGPGTVYYTSISRYSESSYLIRSRSNIKLQQVMLSYPLPLRWAQKMGARGVSLSAVARNLGMIWAANKEKMDPDYLYTTGNNYQIPPIVSYSFRVSMNF